MSQIISASRRATPRWFLVRNWTMDIVLRAIFAPPMACLAIVRAIRGCRGLFLQRWKIPQRFVCQGNAVKVSVQRWKIANHLTLSEVYPNAISTKKSTRRVAFRKVRLKVLISS
mmetsp:Transcript_43250/g.106305  ORF Transcript_43250/g.106305 Transcript_43250/m.106305 type:complete len:114 (+) Transcript_43250:100-441(+)